MMRKDVQTPDAPPPVGPYVQAVVAGGLLFASGQIGLDPVTGEMVGDDVEAQAERAIQNLLAVLRAGKLGPENVVRATVYLTDLADFPRVNAVYARHFGKEPPARSTVQVAGLPRGASVEIDLIAAF